jgi:hypothetical protein
VGIWGSNYNDKVDIYGSNYSDKVGKWGSNYSDKVGIYGSNYSDKVGIYGSNYNDKVGICGSNYSDKVGIYSSNYSDKVGLWGSNYSDKVGIYSSNYSDKVDVWGSNYGDKVGVWGSNYTFRLDGNSSNYVTRINTELTTAIAPLTNYWTKDEGTNIYLNQTGNVGIGTATNLTNKLQVQGTMTTSGLFTGNTGITVPSPQILTSVGTLTTSVINVSGLITGNTGITIPSGQTLTSVGTLTTSVINASGLITATNATAGTTDRLNIQYDTRNGIRFQQSYIAIDDVRYDLIHKVANVDKTSSLTFYNGNVGIGTTVPTNTLEIGIKDGVLYPTGKTFSLVVTGSAYINNTLNFSKSFYGSFGNYPCNKINFYPLVGYGNGFGYGSGTMDYFTGGLYGSGTHLFYTGASDTSLGTERMRIVGSTGNVGIGTTSPLSSYKLHVEGFTYSANALVFSNNYNGGGADYACNKICMFGGGNTPTTTGQYGFGISSYTIDYFSSQYHRFRYGGSGTNFGSVGMELNNNSLTVNGAISAGTSIYATTTIQASGAYYFANNLWNNSNEGENRIYFGSSGTTYIRGTGNSTLTSIVFRSTTQFDMSYFTGSVFYCYGPINLSDRRIKRDIEEINDETTLNMILSYKFNPLHIIIGTKQEIRVMVKYMDLSHSKLKRLYLMPLALHNRL